MGGYWNVMKIEAYIVWIYQYDVFMFITIPSSFINNPSVYHISTDMANIGRQESTSIPININVYTNGAERTHLNIIL